MPFVKPLPFWRLALTIAFIVVFWVLSPQANAIASPAANEPMAENSKLLPQRPKDFNPMQMPPLVAEGDFAPHSMESVSPVYMAQLNGYIAQLTYMIRWLVLVTTTLVLLFVVHLFYMRAKLQAADNLMEAVRLSLELQAARMGNKEEK